MRQSLRAFLKVSPLLTDTEIEKSPLRQVLRPLSHYVHSPMAPPVVSRTSPSRNEFYLKGLQESLVGLVCGAFLLGHLCDLNSLAYKTGGLA